MARGAPLIVGAALLWGTIGVLSTGLFRAGVSPWEVAFWRAALSAGALLPALALRRPAALRLASLRDLALLSAFGVVGVGVFYISFQLATFLTSVAVAVVLLYTAPLFVLLGARLLLGEALTPAKGVMAVLVVLGVAATSLGAAGAEVRLTAAGVGWGLVSALSYSAYYLFGRRYLPRFGVARTLVYSLASGAVVLGVTSTLAGHPPRVDFSATSWLLLLALSLGTTLLANSLYYRGLERTDAGTAAVIASVEPVVAALLAWAAFGQRLTAVGWLGVVLVVGGVAAGAGLGRARRLHPQPGSGGPRTHTASNGEP